MNDTRWSDLAGAYALDALEGAEKVAFEAQLVGDADLRRLVDEYREATTGAFADGLPRHDPPPALRAKMLERARRERPGTPSQDTAVVALPSRPRPRSLPWILLAASAAGLLWVSTHNRSLQQDTRGLSSELSALREELAGAQAAAARLDTLTRALGGANVRFATLTGDTDPSLSLVWNAEAGVLVVAANALPPAAPGRTYQLWGIRGTDAPVSLGTFETSAAGTALVALNPGVAADFDLSALTDEPAGGSPQPTTQPFLVGAWGANRE